MSKDSMFTRPGGALGLTRYMRMARFRERSGLCRAQFVSRIGDDLLCLGVFDTKVLAVADEVALTFRQALLWHASLHPYRHRDGDGMLYRMLSKRLPKFETPAGEGEATYLERLARQKGVSLVADKRSKTPDANALLCWHRLNFVDEVDGYDDLVSAICHEDGTPFPEAAERFHEAFWPADGVLVCG